MSETVEMMLSSFRECKESGSYILFYILALGLGFTVIWERFGKERQEDNWMVEAAKNKIQLWPFLYGILMFVLIVGNPVFVWLFQKITPVGGQYYKLWSLLLGIFISAYGMVCFLCILREKKQKLLLSVGFVILIGLAGSGFGILSQEEENLEYKEEKEIARFIKEEEGTLVLATDAMVEYLSIFEPEISLLYGKDLYTPNLDLGIMDAYSEEFLHLYEALKQPEGSMGEISNVAYIYDCDVIVVKQFENAPDKAGAFYKKETTHNYIVYMR